MILDKSPSGNIAQPQFSSTLYSSPTHPNNIEQSPTLSSPVMDAQSSIQMTYQLNTLVPMISQLMQQAKTLSNEL